MKPFAEVPLTLVDTWDDAQDLRDWLGGRRDWLGLDLETSGLDLGRDRVRMVQVGDTDRGWAIPVDRWGWGVLAREVLEGYDRPMVLHNAIFDLSFLRRDGIGIRADLVHDSMVMAHLVDSGRSVALKSVARRLVGDQAAGGQDVLSQAMKKQKWGWGDVPAEFPGYWQYSALDPVLTARIATELWPLIQPFRTSYDLELAAIVTLARAQVTGMAVDVTHARAESERLASEMAQLQPRLPCNPDSHPALAKWMRERGAVLPKKTKAGKDSIDDDVLKLNEERIPECGVIREYRKRSKLKRSYFDNLLEIQAGGFVHPQIRVLGAEKTGRMSVSAPALQTLPKSRVGRSSFVARPDHTLIAADFEGQEMRMLAHMAGEERMLQEFRKGTDMHSWVASQVYHQDPPTKAQRVVAKSAAFAKIYGAGAEKFAATAGVSVQEGQHFLALYDELFPGVREFQIENAREVTLTSRGGNSGRVATWTGRELVVPSEKAYKATNYKIQGGCSELTKLKIGELSNAGLAELIRLPIHDEIIFEAPDDQAEDAAGTIAAVMAEHDRFDLPFPVEVESVKRWGDAYDDA